MMSSKWSSSLYNRVRQPVAEHTVHRHATFPDYVSFHFKNHVTHRFVWFLGCYKFNLLSVFQQPLRNPWELYLHDGNRILFQPALVNKEQNSSSTCLSPLLKEKIFMFCIQNFSCLFYFSYISFSVLTLI
jgi:hypothetical protein